MPGETYAIRIRFRATKGIATDQDAIEFQFANKNVRLASTLDQDMSRSGWFSLEAHGFGSATEAHAFGKTLSLALQISSARNHWGVDIGHDRAGLQFSEDIAADVSGADRTLRHNVHGLDVFAETPKPFWFEAGIKGHVSISPEAIIADIQRYENSGTLPDAIMVAIRLWNEGYMAGDPAARLVLAVAAVESLVLDPPWSSGQKAALKEAAEIVDREQRLSEAERNEITEAIGRMHRQGIRQGFRGLFSNLGLQAILTDWLQLYDERSAFVHGGRYSDHIETLGIAEPASRLAGEIVLAALAVYVPGAADDLGSRTATEQKG